MSIKDYKKRLDDWAQQFENPYWKPHEIMARLSEETGELAREINHLYGPKKKKAEEETKDLGNEIADIIITLICMANSHNINLDEAMERVFEKIDKRDTKRFEKNCESDIGRILSYFVFEQYVPASV